MGSRSAQPGHAEPGRDLVSPGWGQGLPAGHTELALPPAESEEKLDWPCFLLSPVPLGSGGCAWWHRGAPCAQFWKPNCRLRDY